MTWKHMPWKNKSLTPSRNDLAVKHASENIDPEGSLGSMRKLHRSASKQDLVDRLFQQVGKSAL